MQDFPLLCINRVADGAIKAYRVVAASDVDGQVAQAAESTDALVGVAGKLGAANGERIDINFAGIVPVEYGDTVTYGDLLTSDAQGRAVPASPGDRVIGVAQEEGDEGVIGSVLIAPSALAPEPETEENEEEPPPSEPPPSGV